MKKLVIAGTLAAAVAVGGTALAQQPAQTTPPPKTTPPAQTTPPPKTTPPPQTTPPAQTTPESPAKPAKAHAHAKKSDEGAAGTHTAPKQQPNTAEAPNATSQAIPLGTVHLPAALKGDGKVIPAGTYQVRLTTETAKGDARGASDGLERWAEFMKGGQVVGREIVTIIPANEAKLVVKDAPPPAGGSKVQALRGGEYTWVWFNRAGTLYLVHLLKG